MNVVAHVRYGALVLFVVASCATTSPVASRPQESSVITASAARTQTPPPASIAPATASYAVIVKDFLEGGPTYTVSLVATDGHVAASATPMKRSRFVQIGNLSTSLTTLYYLDGDSDVRYLRPDGSTGLATTITLAANQVAAFAVSPDDRRIAVSVLDFTKYPVGTRLYVEDVARHTNHLELFSSTTIEEWPAGWHKGRLVMALGFNVPPQNQYEGFLRGHGYHVADAQTGSRLRSLCEGMDSYVPESPGGTVCVQSSSSVTVVSWDGVSWLAPKDGNCPMWGPLAPTGLLMANRRTATPGSGCRSDSVVFLVDAGGVAYPQPNLPDQEEPGGWIDDSHLLLTADSPATGLSIVNTSTGFLAPVAGVTGFFAAALPGGL